jgi:hypothetical protein
MKTHYPSMQGFTIEYQRAFSLYFLVREPFSAVAAISAHKTSEPCFKFGASASSAVVSFAVCKMATMTSSV